ncbi:MAG TPA: glycosyltransferase [Acidocella sp.]|nr:glycosyltransferase [Acidocella sp.]
MKFLFVHQNFPGQYLHIVRSLLADNEARPGTHEIVFMTEPNANNLVGVRKVTYAKPPLAVAGVHRDAHDFDMAMRRAEACAAGARQIKKLGFVPDIIIGHHGWGEMLNLCDVFPGVPILGYFEFFYQTENSDVNFDPEFITAQERFAGVRAKNALAPGEHGQVPTVWQKSTYPDWAQPGITLLKEGVDLSLCKPAAARAKRNLQVGKINVTAQQKLITYVARNLEPYRGFHTFMRALPAILKARPDVVVSVVGGDEISYGAPHPNGPWREVLLAELQGQIDLDRVHFPGKIPYDDHLALLKRSDAHVYLSYPFVASWSLREALACGCLVIGSDTPTVTEFVKHRKNGLVTSALDHTALAETVLMALESPKLTAPLRLAAREFAEKHLDLQDYLARYRRLIEKVAGKALADAPIKAVRPKAAAPQTAPAASPQGKAKPKQVA